MKRSAEQIILQVDTGQKNEV